MYHLRIVVIKNMPAAATPVPRSRGVLFLFQKL